MAADLVMTEAATTAAVAKRRPRSMQRRAQGREKRPNTYPEVYPEVFTCTHVSKIRGRNTVLPNFLPDCLRVVLLLPVLLGYQRKVVYTLVWLVG